MNFLKSYNEIHCGQYYCAYYYSTNRNKDFILKENL